MSDLTARVALPPFQAASLPSGTEWDVIVVGAGHNGLTCAAYLARAGKRVLVLEARSRLGGACTIEEPWPGVFASPCAYLAGLLHPRVVDELDLPRRGFRWTPASNGLFVPFEDGSSIQLYDDDDACEAEIRRFSSRDVSGWHAMTALIARVRDRLRPANDSDLWLHPAPDHDEILQRLGEDPEARGLLFEWSMAEFVERYLEDERLRIAYLGQGVIGTNASPFDPGTASIRFHHSSGRLGGIPGGWGYVDGGIGTVSALIAEAAREAGATLIGSAPVAAINPGEGVVLEGGERILAPVVVSNADPKVTLRLLGASAEPTWRQRVEAIPMEGCTLKMNVLLRELPDFLARPGQDQPHHRGQLNTPLSREQWKSGFAAARRGEIGDRLWTELYIQTTHDRSIIRDGLHMMSVFAQYVPYRWSEGSWDDHRARAARIALDSIGRFCSNLDRAVAGFHAFGPPDIEKNVGLTGGHIFHGECLPGQMWSRRLSSATPMPGVFLCGAGTHPGGSVIAANGRNAAMAVLKEDRA